MKLEKEIKLKKLLLLKLSIIPLFLVIFSLGVHAQKIDSLNSVVKFEIDGIGWSEVEGEIKGMSGSLVFDKNNLALSFFNVCINTSTIFTDSEKRDTHLKDPDFFDVKKYSTICFKSSNVAKVKEGYKVKGELTILNKTKETEFDFRVIIESGQRILVGKFEINRFDFGLAAESYSSTMMVGKTVKIEIRCVLLD